MAQPMEEYRDSLGRMRRRRARCANHPEEFADKILVYRLQNGAEIYEPVCGPCLDVYEEYDGDTR